MTDTPSHVGSVHDWFGTFPRSGSNSQKKGILTIVKSNVVYVKIRGSLTNSSSLSLQWNDSSRFPTQVVSFQLDAPCTSVQVVDNVIPVIFAGADEMPMNTSGSNF
ncbi:hypothetical protein JTE90_010103 [Oedothorax gibbosus]|uniref:Uncharacterized protein n=1 Tax=Oedothorax gibbosus TaxID=931172 RepID=A0AAV6U4T0_9ARAC|nr:hypothetical protein JTE90_010103 [Oedothorax gibbosus]